MGPAEECKQQAAECVLLAQQAPDANDRVIWLILAEAWIGLADDVSRLRTVIAMPGNASDQAA
jgi:hypothetical protein